MEGPHSGEPGETWGPGLLALTYSQARSYPGSWGQDPSPTRPHPPPGTGVKAGPNQRLPNLPNWLQRRKRQPYHPFRGQRVDKGWEQKCSSAPRVAPRCTRLHSPPSHTQSPSDPPRGTMNSGEEKWVRKECHWEPVTAVPVGTRGRPEQQGPSQRAPGRSTPCTPALAWTEGSLRSTQAQGWRGEPRSPI